MASVQSRKRIISVQRLSDGTKSWVSFDMILSVLGTSECSPKPPHPPYRTCIMMYDLTSVQVDEEL